MGSCWKLHDKIAVQKMANTGEKFSKPVCPPFPPSNTRGRYTPRRRRPSLSRSATVALGSLVDILLCRHREIISKNTGDEHLVSFVYLSEGARQALLGVCVFRSGGVSGPQRELFSCCGLGRPQAAPQQVLILPAVLSLG